MGLFFSDVGNAAPSDPVRPKGADAMDKMLATRRARLETMTPEENARFEAGKMLGSPLSEPGAQQQAAPPQQQPALQTAPVPPVRQQQPATAKQETVAEADAAGKFPPAPKPALKPGEPNWFDKFNAVLGKVEQKKAPPLQNAPIITASSGNGGQGGSLSGAMREEAQRRQAAPTYYDKFAAMFRGR